MRCQCVGANGTPDARDAVTTEDADQASAAVLNLRLDCVASRSYFLSDQGSGEAATAGRQSVLPAGLGSLPCLIATQPTA
jgi:hypothetical protein